MRVLLEAVIVLLEAVRVLVEAIRVLVRRSCEETLSFLAGWG
jgi:hypothetical protein